MNSCDSFLSLISASLDGALTDEERKTLDAHLADCPDCRALWEQLNTIESDLMELEVPSADFTDRVMARAAETEQDIPFTNLPQNRNGRDNARRNMRAWWHPIRNWGLVAVCVVLVLGVSIRLASSGRFTRTDGGNVSDSASIALETEESAVVDEAAAETEASDLETAAAAKSAAPALKRNGQSYLWAEDVEELPEGCAETDPLTEEEAGDTGLAGAACWAAADGQALYVQLPEGGWARWVPSA